MKKKDEREADLGLKQLGVAPRIYIFNEDVTPFIAITIAEYRLTWAAVRRELNTILPHVRFFPHERATRLRRGLHNRDIHGVAICDSQEPNLNKRLGRTIAKGRLLKHLQKRGMKKVER